jgi:hypothetical protein
MSLSSWERAASLRTPVPESRLVVIAWSCLFFSLSSPTFFDWNSFSFFAASLPAAEPCAIAFTSTNAIFESCGNGVGGAGLANVSTIARTEFFATLIE